MRLIIVGCGSMGKRRARCLRKLGYKHIAGVDPRPDRRAEIEQQSKVKTFATFEEATRDGADFVVVCVAPHLHADYLTRCIEAGYPVFCEAPLTLTLDEADLVIGAAEQNNVFIAPSCTYLHNRIHTSIKEWLDEERFGRPLAAISHVGQHVADWHPYEDYRSFYASKRSEGGMCVDMLPHDLHLFCWYFGEVKALTCQARRRGRDIETDPKACDVYDVLLDMEAGVSLMLHQDMFQRPGGVYRKIMCERGTIEWNWRELRACEYTGPQFPHIPAWQNVLPEPYDFEDMYISELAHAFHVYESKTPYLLPPCQERRILELVLACEKSSYSGLQMTWPVHGNDSDD